MDSAARYSTWDIIPGDAGLQQMLLAISQEVGI